MNLKIDKNIKDIQYFNEVINILNLYPKDDECKKKKSIAYISLANIYKSKSNIYKTIEYYWKSIYINKNLLIFDENEYIFSELANLMKKIGEYEIAIEFYKVYSDIYEIENCLKELRKDQYMINYELKIKEGDIWCFLSLFEKSIQSYRESISLLRRKKFEKHYENKQLKKIYSKIKEILQKKDSELLKEHIFKIDTFIKNEKYIDYKHIEVEKMNYKIENIIKDKRIEKNIQRIEEGKKPNTSNNINSFDNLIEYIINGHLDKVKQCQNEIETFKDNHMRTPLHISIIYDQFKIYKYLIEKNKNQIYSKDFEGKNILYHMIEKNRFKFINHLFESNKKIKQLLNYFLLYILIIIDLIHSHLSIH